MAISERIMYTYMTKKKSKTIIVIMHYIIHIFTLYLIRRIRYIYVICGCVYLNGAAAAGIATSAIDL